MKQQFSDAGQQEMQGNLQIQKAQGAPHKRNMKKRT